jgi:hypothetical protein
MPEHRSLSLIQLITLSLSKLSLLQTMASNDNGKRKLQEEVESSMARKRLRLSDDDVGDDNSSDTSKEEIEEEKEEDVSSEQTSMNQLDTSKEKLFAKHGCGMIFRDDKDTTSPSSELCTPESHRRFDEDSSNKDNENDGDFWM